MAPLLNEEEAAIDPYALLGVHPDAAEAEIKSAYRKLSLKCHPDRNPDNPNAAHQFHVLSLALGMLIDPSKRSYLNTKLADDRRKRDKYAAMEKKKRGLVDALLAREEEAKRAKLDAGQRFAQASEEEAIKQAGRKMREAMQNSQGRTGKPTVLAPREALDGETTAATTARPAMGPADLTVTLLFPADASARDVVASSTTLEPRITALYGPVNFVILKEGSTTTTAAEGGKRKKPRGAKAIVEFKEGNWSGCWACWKDHVADPITGKARRPLVDGTKIKWANKDGTPPTWISWAESQQPSTPLPPPLHPTRPKVSTSFASSFAASFPSAEDRRQQQVRDAEADAARLAAEDYEGATLFRMRQLERERLEAEIRREEGDEG